MSARIWIVSLGLAGALLGIAWKQSAEKVESGIQDARPRECAEGCVLGNVEPVGSDCRGKANPAGQSPEKQGGSPKRPLASAGEPVEGFALLGGKYNEARQQRGHGNKQFHWPSFSRFAAESTE